MSLRGLEALLRPKSIAVVGTSNTPGRAGNLMMRNLLDGGFSGPVLPVTPKYPAVCRVLSVSACGCWDPTVWGCLRLGRA